MKTVIYRIIESQKVLDQKGPLEVIQSNPRAESRDTTN